MTEPTDKELEAFAIEEQFLLFCDVDEFTQIARAVLAKWGTPQPVVRDDTELIRQMLAAMEPAMGAWAGTCAWHGPLKSAITAARARLENT